MLDSEQILDLKDGDIIYDISNNKIKKHIVSYTELSIIDNFYIAIYFKGNKRFMTV
ncbi:MAG: hypothetical protein RR585_13675 [Coprobacillus sp.]